MDIYGEALPSLKDGMIKSTKALNRKQMSDTGWHCELIREESFLLVTNIQRQNQNQYQHPATPLLDKVCMNHTGQITEKESTYLPLLFKH